MKFSMFGTKSVSKAFFTALVISILVNICNSFPLETRQLQGSSWSLYVYGENINGLPVCYADGENSLIPQEVNTKLD